jgi:hypothetical protein
VFSVRHAKCSRPGNRAAAGSGSTIRRVAVAGAVVAALGLVLAFVPGERGALRLPDLEQELPTELEIHAVASPAGPVYWLGFRSAVRNVGSGPLIIDGARSGTGQAFIQADQVLRRADGSEARVPAVGRLVFVDAETHRHWHYLGFDRYELRRPGFSSPVVRDRKSGFCLGDRYEVDDPKPARAARRPVYTSRCGLGRPDLLGLREGISVGYGDDYRAFLEGQDLRLSGLPDGLYVLVHEANADRRLRELSYGNNAASVLLELRWREGVPSVHIRAVCPRARRCARPS